MAHPAEEIWDLVRANNQALQELIEQSKETDRRMQETDRQMKETDRQMKETDRKLENLSVMLGRQGNRLGDFVQEMVRPAVVRLLRERGLPVHQVLRNITALDDDGNFLAEIDLLAINAKVCVAVECKSHLGVDDVREHLERLAGFKGWFGQYQGYEVMGAVAGMVVSDETARFAYRRGLFVLAQSGDGVLIRNDGRFQPKVW